MSKMITPKELAEIVTSLLTFPEALGELGEMKTRMEFMREVGELVASYCGGEIGDVLEPMSSNPLDGDDALLMLSVRPDERLPSREKNVWSAYDPEGWEDEPVEG